MMESPELPEHLIQRIQSLLTSKQAARTTLLSKSWLAAFITRPNLDFDQADFLPSELVPYVLNTIKKYSKSRLKIHSFRICVQSSWHSHYTKMIRRALVKGATRLSVQANSRRDIYIPSTRLSDVQAQTGHFYVPKEVLESENLVSLTLKGAVIYHLDQEVTCSKLESLCLENVAIKSRDLFPRIISTCPLIQNLSLSCVSVYDEDSHLVVLDTLFLRDLSFSFPALKDLTLGTLAKKGEEDMLISSTSLERLEIKLWKDSSWYRGSSRVQGIRFDLPSIRKLTIAGPAGIPLLSLRSNLCVDKNISTARSKDLNQVRAQINVTERRWLNISDS